MNITLAKCLTNVEQKIKMCGKYLSVSRHWSHKNCGLSMCCISILLGHHPPPFPPPPLSPYTPLPIPPSTPPCVANSHMALYIEPVVLAPTWGFVELTIAPPSWLYSLFDASGKHPDKLIQMI